MRDAWDAYLLNQEDSDAAEMRAFYAREEARTRRKAALWLAGQAIKWGLVIIGAGTVVYVLAVLWMLS